MGLEDPYTARDIGINSLGRVSFVSDFSQFDQAINRTLVKHLRLMVGSKVPALYMDAYLRANLATTTEEFRAAQDAAPNLSQYTGNELLSTIDLVSVTSLSPGTLSAEVIVYFKSGKSITVSTSV